MFNNNILPHGRLTIGKECMSVLFSRVYRMLIGNRDSAGQIRSTINPLFPFPGLSLDGKSY